MALMKRMSRRGRIRLWSFLLTAIIVLGGFALTGFSLAAKYRMRLEYGYEQSLNQLSEHLNNIEITLTKGMYSGTPQGTADFAMNLWSEAGSAKTCLAALPTYEQSLDGTYKFLSQVGEYSLALSKKMAQTGSVDETEREQLAKLSKHAKQLSQMVAEMCVEMNEGGMWSDHVKKVISENSSGEDSILSEGMTQMEQGFTDYPTLLYDGPFSDHIEQAQPLFIKGKENISSTTGLETAAKLTDYNTEQFKRINDTEGKIPCYNYTNGDVTVSLTKAGGYCAYLLSSRAVENASLTYENCLEKAYEFLKKLDFGNFKESYYMINEGVCVINFAYLENSTIYYTDLVKVGVAMDNGEIVSFDSTGYIMNHRQRNVSAPKYALKDAQGVLSDLLTVKSSNTAVIPLDTIEERLCYEFLCESQSGEQVLVYVNANTLAEEDIKILIKDDGGILTV